MWHDNETDRDFLNFGGVSETVAEMIAQAAGRPISIGVSGTWGIGKSSLIKLIRGSLEKRNQQSRFVFVEFNAWLYQGYDDARAALMYVIAEKLNDEAERRKTGIDKTKELLARVNWLRLVKLGVGTAAAAVAMAHGIPPVGVIGTVTNLGADAFAGDVSADDLDKAGNAIDKVAQKADGFLKAKQQMSPPKEIQALRNNFEEALKALDVTLVVLIDDLDRCLPPTTISTLEAIRLFLFLNKTAFVIAADNEMIKHAVRQHFTGVDESLVTSYFDKLIQVPIRVPPLGTQEVRAYLMMLFVENSTLSPADMETVRARVCKQLAETWKGSRVDRAFMQKLGVAYPTELIAQFDTADRLAPIMTTATQIAGNPRLIKRFLNALSIRMSISKAQGVGVDEAALAKMLLFERCGDPNAYDELLKAVNQSDDGKPRFLEDWEVAANTGKELKLEAPWDSAFIREWLTLSPPLAEQDLRGVLYVSREHRPLVTPEDRLSSTGAELLGALLAQPAMAASLKDRVKALPRGDLEIILDRLLKRAQQEQDWGTPPILEACLVVAKSDENLGKRLAGFLRDRPASQVKPSIVPKISAEPWAHDVFETWKGSTVSAPVKRAITTSEKNGNV
jgi:predicted KAP-like P-loop ATPase